MNSFFVLRDTAKATYKNELGRKKYTYTESFIKIS